MSALGSALRRIAGAAVSAGRTVARLPAVVEAIGVLPTISAQLEQVTEHTRCLPEIHAEMAAVAVSTSALEGMSDRLDLLAGLIAEMSETLHLLAAVAEPLQGTAARIGRLTGGRLARRTPPSRPLHTDGV